MTSRNSSEPRNPFELGYDAYYKGVDYWENPFKDNEADELDWANGFAKAEEEDGA